MTKSIKVTNFKFNDEMICLVDTPGHCHYLKSIMRGIAMADALVIVVPAVEEVLPHLISFDDAAIAARVGEIGGKNIIVVVSRMDKGGYE